MAHYNSEHLATVDISLFVASFVPETRVSLPTAAAGALGKLGINFIGASNLTVESLDHGKYPSISSVIEWLRAELHESGDKKVDIGAFLVQYLICVCTHASTNKTAGLGMFRVYYLIIPETEDRSWSSLFSAYAAWRARVAQEPGTPRNLQVALDSLLLATWNSDVPAVKDLKANGTPRSSKYRTADGRSPPAWWVVPNLFQAMRSEIPPDFADMFNDTVNLDESSGDPTYYGLDQDNDISDRLMTKRENSVRTQLLKLRLGKSETKPQ